MTVYDNPDRRVAELNARARLLLEVAATVASLDHELSVRVELLAGHLADEAMMIVAEDGAQPGQSYHHHEGVERPCLGKIGPIVETAQPGDAL